MIEKVTKSVLAKSRVFFCNRSYLGRKKVSVDVSKVSDLSLCVGNKVGENPTDSDEAKRLCNFLHLIFFVVLQDFN